MLVTRPGRAGPGSHGRAAAARADSLPSAARAEQRLAQGIRLFKRHRGKGKLGALAPPAAASTSTRTSPSSRCKKGAVTSIPRTRSSGIVRTERLRTPECSSRRPPPTR